MQGGGGACLPRALDRRGKDLTEVMYQISRFHSFLWLSGGSYNDFYIHHIDHLCWMKNAWPVKAQALGGKYYKTSTEGEPFVDQNFDSYSVEYTFADGTKIIMVGRCVAETILILSIYVNSDKGMTIT